MMIVIWLIYDPWSAGILGQLRSHFVTSTYAGRVTRDNPAEILDERAMNVHDLLFYLLYHVPQVCEILRRTNVAIAKKWDNQNTNNQPE